MSQLDNILEKLRRVAQDPDVDDKKGTQPKKYYSGVKLSLIHISEPTRPY